MILFGYQVDTLLIGLLHLILTLWGSWSRCHCAIHTFSSVIRPNQNITIYNLILVKYFAYLKKVRVPSPLRIIVSFHKIKRQNWNTLTLWKFQIETERGVGELLVFLRRKNLRIAAQQKRGAAGLNFTPLLLRGLSSTQLLLLVSPDNYWEELQLEQWQPQLLLSNHHPTTGRGKRNCWFTSTNFIYT